jgi:hypothetical protein
MVHGGQRKTATGGNFRLRLTHFNPPPGGLGLCGTFCDTLGGKEIAAPVERRKWSVGRKPVDRRPTFHFPPSRPQAAPHPLSVAFCFNLLQKKRGRAGAGEMGSRGAAETAMLARSALALLPSWRSWRARRFNFPRAQTVRIATRARQVQTFSGQVRTFSARFAPYSKH